MVKKGVATVLQVVISRACRMESLPMIQVMSVGLLSSPLRSADRELGISIQKPRALHAGSRLNIHVRRQHFLRQVSEMRVMLLRWRRTRTLSNPLGFGRAAIASKIALWSFVFSLL